MRFFLNPSYILSYIRIVYSKLFSLMAALLSPPTCVGCHTFVDERVPLCSTCDEMIKPIVSTEIMITASYTMKVFSVSEYTGVIRSLIMAKQLGNRLSSKQLGGLIATRCVAEWDRYDYIIPVPLHWRRYAERGFNQSEEMARVIGALHGIVLSMGVVRKRATIYQATLEQKARRQNVSEAFEISEMFWELYHGKHVLLVDDVLTTGSTLSEMARVIARCRPASISAVVAARVILK